MIATKSLRQTGKAVRSMAAMSCNAIVVSVLLAPAASVANANDFNGAVLVDAHYNYAAFPDYNNEHIYVDVMYDKAGGAGHAWGKFSYLRPGDSSLSPYAVYAEATCVGKFTGNKFTVAGPIVKQTGTLYGPGSYLVYEFDVSGGGLHGYPVNSLAAAQAACNTQVGVFDGAVTQGFVIAK